METFTVRTYSKKGCHGIPFRCPDIESASHCAFNALHAMAEDGSRAVIEKPDGSTYEYRLNLQMSGGPGLPWK